MYINLKSSLLSEHSRDETSVYTTCSTCSFEKIFCTTLYLYFNIFKVHSYVSHFKSHVRTDLSCFQCIIQNLYL